ncbi:MAG: hypothetical protein QOJ11_1707 [Frankiales bacterium]|jgi:hypothetical protein|nr:hypothetical protein [Frankiales bacterium]
MPILHRVASVIGRLAAVGSAFAVLALAAAPAGAASPSAVATKAPSLGVLSVSPAKATDLVAFSLITSAACPSGGTNIIGTILGPGLPVDGINVVPNTTAKLFPRTTGGGYFMPSNNTLRALVNQLPDPQALKGTYRLRVECRGPAKIADLGDFSGSLVFDGHHGYVAHQPDVPKGSLQTLAPTPDPALPSVAASAPSRPSPSPAVVKAQPAAATRPSSSSSGAAPWLIGGGALIVAAGTGTLLRGRRGRTKTAAR